MTFLNFGRCVKTHPVISFVVCTIVCIVLFCIGILTYRIGSYNVFIAHTKMSALLDDYDSYLDDYVSLDVTKVVQDTKNCTFSVFLSSPDSQFLTKYTVFYSAEIVKDDEPAPQLAVWFQGEGNQFPLKKIRPYRLFVLKLNLSTTGSRDNIIRYHGSVRGAMFSFFDGKKYKFDFELSLRAYICGEHVEVVGSIPRVDTIISAQPAAK